jgi:hypothetical protein
MMAHLHAIEGPVPPRDEARVAVLFIRLEGDREDEAGEEKVPEEEVDDEEECGDGSPFIVRREEVGEIDATEEDPQLVPGGVEGGRRRWRKMAWIGKRRNTACRLGERRHSRLNHRGNVERMESHICAVWSVGTEESVSVPSSPSIHPPTHLIHHFKRLSWFTNHYL